MTTGKTCLAIITARGGSKGIPRKNVRHLAGKPLIAYPIELALSCSFITRTMVTTDSEEIRDLALKAGAEAPFLRPGELASDTAKQEDAILHAMAWYEKEHKAFDYICLLTPTTPLARPETLNRAFQSLVARPDADSVFSVSECSFSPLFCNSLRPDGLMKGWVDLTFKWCNRQELPQYYRLSGGVTLSKWGAFKREKSFLHDKTLSFVMDPVEAIDIDTPLDFLTADLFLKNGVRNAEGLERFYRQEIESSGVR